MMDEFSSGVLPKETQVVVIGGGIIGAITALEFAERGIGVVLCEKGEFGAEQSGLNLGWCRQLGRDARELPLSMQALQLWSGMNRRIQGDTGFRQAGIVHVASTEEEFSGFSDRLSSAGPFASRIGLEIIDGDTVASFLPGARQPFCGGLYCKSDGRAEPKLATRAILIAAARLGARLLRRCAVRGFDIANRKVVGVMTERGLVRCSAVVLAGGIWSRHLLRSIDISFPQLYVSETLLKTTPIDLGHGPSMTNGRIAHRPTLDGGYVIAHESNTVNDIIPASFRYARNFMPAVRQEFKRLHFRVGRSFLREFAFVERWPIDQPSPFERFRHVQPRPSSRRVLSAYQEMQRLFPKLRSSSVATLWSGYIDVMPDAIPVISDVSQLDGLWLATGFSGHGFGIAPAAGRLVADLVVGNTPSVDPTPFSFGRFTSPTMQHSAHKSPTN